MGDDGMVGLVSLGLEVGPLKELECWEPVGALLGLVASSANGDEGFTRKELDRMRLWARRWRKLHPDLRRFYQLEVEHGAATYYKWSKVIDSALWSILHSEVEVKPSATLYRAISTRWVRRYGTEPIMEMIPNLSHIQLRRNDAPCVQKEVGDRRT